VTRTQGTLLVIGATTLWGLNGSLSKVLLDDALTSTQLTQIRVSGAFALLLLGVLATRPATLRATLGQIVYLVVFGLFGLTAVQLLYFLALERLQIGVALLIEYLAPVLVALYARFVLKDRVGRGLWIGIVLVLVGLALMLDVAGGDVPELAGLAFAFSAAFAYALYILMTDRIKAERPPVATITWGFGVSALFWLIVQPLWSFPFGSLNQSIDLGGNLSGTTVSGWVLVGAVVVFGTVLPFAMLVSSLHALPAARVTLIATFEPVAAALFARLWLGQQLDTVQLLGGALVMAGIVAAELASVHKDAAPAAPP